MKEQQQIRELVTIVCTPHDLYWASEIEVQLSNFERVGHTGEMHVLVFVEGEFPYRWYWEQLAKRYTWCKFFYYKEDNIKNLIAIYAPVQRPRCLKNHWKQFPELQNKVILYLDSDVLFTRTPDFSPYLQDDICYLSKTEYISADYFSSKVKDIYPFKKKEYAQEDVLQDLCRIVGIDKQVAIDNQDNTGGCQYILKGIDYDFCNDVERNCIELRLRTINFNAQYFSSEDKGFQSWAIGDMCGLLWNLWKRGKETKCPEYMNFAWSTNPIDAYNDNIFFHNAGVSSKNQELDGKMHKMFYKSDIRFRTSSLTWFDIQEWGGISKEYCSYKYLEEILSIENPICRTKKLVY